MDGIDFYYVPESPHCRMVELVAYKLNIKLNKKFVNIFCGEHLSEDFVKINPVHCVPTIVDGEQTIWESRAVACYLINRYAKSEEDKSLYPSDATIRAKVDMMLYFEAGILYRAQVDLLSPMCRGRPVTDAIKERKFKEALAFVDNTVSKTNYIIGDTLTVADMAIVCGLTYGEACDYDFSEFKALNEYRDRVKGELPGYDSINVEPMRRFKSYVSSRGLSLLSSSRYWKFLLSDEVTNVSKIPSLCSSIIGEPTSTTTSTTFEMAENHDSSTNNHGADTSVDNEEKQLEKKLVYSKKRLNSSKSEQLITKPDQGTVLPKRHKKIEYCKSRT